MRSVSLDQSRKATRRLLSGMGPLDVAHENIRFGVERQGRKDTQSSWKGGKCNQYIERPLFTHTAPGLDFNDPVPAM
jgi:hypothetical protein